MTVTSGTATLTAATAWATATVPVPSTLASGTYTVNITYGGDTNYSASSAATSASLHVGQIATTVSLASSANPTPVSAAVTLTATVSASGGTPTGSVSFYDGTTLLGTVALSSGHASYTTSGLAAGSHSITATYSGDTNYSGGTSAAVVLSVGQITPTIAIVANVNPAIATSAVTFTATVSSSGGTPTGSVSFYDGTTLLGTVTLTSGTAAYTTSSLTVGTNNITAVYSGNSTFQTVTSAAVAELVQDFTLSTPTSADIPMQRLFRVVQLPTLCPLVLGGHSVSCPRDLEPERPSPRSDGHPLSADASCGVEPHLRYAYDPTSPANYGIQ